MMTNHTTRLDELQRRILRDTVQHDTGADAGDTLASVLDHVKDLAQIVREMVRT